jgi:hypothetical protein
LLNVLESISQAGAGFSLSCRYLGRYHNTAWAADAYRLGGLAEFEQELIKARTGEGRRQGEGSRRAYGEVEQADGASEARGDCPA